MDKYGQIISCHIPTKSRSPANKKTVPRAFTALQFVEGIEAIHG